MSKTAKMYHKITENEHENAFVVILVSSIQHRKAVELDYLKAYHLYKKVTYMGYVGALKALDITLETNLQPNGDTEENYSDSFSKTYNSSLAEVQFQVGFAHGHCISEPDYVEAHKLYSIAAKISHKEALHHLIKRIKHISTVEKGHQSN
ncbi:hypothetical protein K501DRAFT_274630 [Backusella circina FSU 941]|nr:hypothetical protein K501DRAFT_274630 [Backusella circina FSU 941]